MRPTTRTYRRRRAKQGNAVLVWTGIIFVVCLVTIVAIGTSQAAPAPRPVSAPQAGRWQSSEPQVSAVRSEPAPSALPVQPAHAVQVVIAPVGAVPLASRSATAQAESVNPLTTAPVLQVAMPTASATATDLPRILSWPLKSPKDIGQARVIAGWQDEPAARHAWSDIPHAVTGGTFEVPSTMRGSPVLTCDFLVPVDAAGKPLPTSADVITVFPYKNQTATIMLPNALKFVANWGFTVLSVRYPNDATVDTTDRATYYRWPDSGSGQATLDAHHKLYEFLRVPPRRMILFGQSIGASAAHLFAEAYPDAVDILSMEGPGLFAEKPRFTGPRLILHGDPEIHASEVAAYLANQPIGGFPLRHGSYRSNWKMRGGGSDWMMSHVANDEACLVHQSWIAGAANLRLAHGGQLPPPTEWPADGDPDEPTRAAWKHLGLPVTTPVLADTGICSVLADPPAAIATSRLLLIVDFSFVGTAKDLTLDVQQAADSGAVVMGIRADGRDVAPLIRTYLKGRADLAGRKPYALLLDPPGAAGRDFLKALPEIQGTVITGLTSRRISDLKSLYLQAPRVTVLSDAKSAEALSQVMSGARNAKVEILKPAPNFAAGRAAQVVQFLATVKAWSD